MHSGGQLERKSSEGAELKGEDNLFVIKQVESIEDQDSIGNETIRSTLCEDEGWGMVERISLRLILNKPTLSLKTGRNKKTTYRTESISY
jgi:hypothetical protein